jgi:hypothetical protein
MARYRRRYRYVMRRRMRGRDARLASSAVAAGLVLAVVAGHGHGHVPSGGMSGTQTVAVPVAGGSEAAFITAVLADLGVPPGKRGADVTSLASWFQHEFPSWPPAASWNPMASTLQMPGSTTFNSAGVQNYRDGAEGAQATAQTLADGYYPTILAALRSGDGLCGTAFAGELSTWSGGGYSQVC